MGGKLRLSGGCLQSIGNGGRDGRQSPEVAMSAKCLTHICRTGTGRTGRTVKTAYLILRPTGAVASREREAWFGVWQSGLRVAVN